MTGFEQIESERMHRALREAAGAVTVVPAFAPMLYQHLGEDASRRVARAEKQDVADSLTHDPAVTPHSTTERKTLRQPLVPLPAGLAPPACSRKWTGPHSPRQDSSMRRCGRKRSPYRA